MNIEKYRYRYAARPDTFDAYLEVWESDPEASATFGGWSSFSQGANGEPSQPQEGVAAAERIMRSNGFEIGEPTEHGGRQLTRATRDGSLNAGIRQITITTADGSTIDIAGGSRLEVTFGPHHRLVLVEHAGKTSLELVATHHGVRLDASTVPSEVEEALEVVRAALPGWVID